MKKKTAIYLRVSTSDQSDSLELQEAKCRAYCDINEYEVVNVYSDKNVSGKTNVFERPQGKFLKSGLKNKRFEHIVVLKLDRLSRSTVNGVMTIEEISNLNGTLSLLDFNLDTNTPMGKLVLSNLLSFAQFEREMITERVKSSLKHKKQNLKVYSKITPYGFIRKDKDLIVDKEKVKQIKEIRSSKLSLRKLASKFGITHTIVNRIKKDEIYLNMY
jgi:site-specific DNA recombinase